MSGPRQHTIPKFYLNRFLAPGFVYRRGSLAARLTKNASDVAVRKRYYGPETTDAPDLDVINSHIENWAAPKIEQFLADPESITRTDWHAISWFLANLTVRTPTAVDEIHASTTSFMAQTVDVTKRLLDAHDEAAGLDEAPPVIELPSGLDSQISYSLSDVEDAVKRSKSPDAYLETLTGMFLAIQEIVEIIKKMSWLLLSPGHGSEFLTNDRPIRLAPSKFDGTIDGGWVAPDAVAMVALAPDRYLLLHKGEPYSGRLRSASDEEMTSLNLENLTFAAEEVFSLNKNQDAKDWMLGARR